MHKTIQIMQMIPLVVTFRSRGQVAIVLLVATVLYSYENLQ